jgi:hypothetical protein
MGRPDIRRSKHAPLRIEPERGQVSEYSLEAPNKESRDVLHEDERGSNLANDPSVLAPEPGVLPVDPGPLPGVADVGAGKTPRDEIHSATPRAALEGRNVRPDRRRIQPPFFHASRQYRGGISLPLDETDRAMSAADSSKSSGDAEFESGAAGEESEATDGR